MQHATKYEMISYFSYNAGFSELKIILIIRMGSKLIKSLFYQFELNQFLAMETKLIDAIQE